MSESAPIAATTSTMATTGLASEGGQWVSNEMMAKLIEEVQQLRHELTDWKQDMIEEFGELTGILMDHFNDLIDKYVGKRSPVTMASDGCDADVDTDTTLDEQSQCSSDDELSADDDDDDNETNDQMSVDCSAVNDQELSTRMASHLTIDIPKVTTIADGDNDYDNDFFDAEVD